MGSTRTVTIGEIGEDGEGVARDEGVEIRVPGLIPGDEATVRIVAKSRHRALLFGKCVSIDTASPHRRRSPCESDVANGGDCTGCPLLVMNENARRESLGARLRDQQQLPVQQFVHDPEAQLGYRHSSKRVAFGGPGRLRLGSFRRGSHRPAAMAGCWVEHPRIAEAAAEIEKRAADLGLGAFNAKRGQHGLRYVWLKTDGQRVLVSLIASAEDRSLRSLAERLEGVDGVYQAIQPGEGNAIRGGSPTHLRGLRSLKLSIAGVQTEVGPLGFLQPNPGMAGRCYEDLIEHVGGADRVYDLYAGAGVTTALLRERAAKVTPCESYPESAERLGVPALRAETFLDERKQAGEKPTLIVANPPRGGMGDAVCASLLALAPQRISIMSCSAKALKRDLERLAPDYALERLRAYDTLPQTAHLELVAHLLRRDLSERSS